MQKINGTEAKPQGNDAKPPVQQPPLGSQTHGSQHEVVIGVMGATGSGKSSFIRLLTGNDSVTVGDDLESETSDIQIVRHTNPASGCKVTIVDTPGFDDSREGMTDTEILKRITAFLLDAYDENRKLSGLIFVQRISDPRFSGQSTRNLRIFRNLCGENQYKNVVVLTTFWDTVADADGKRREAQLMSKYFKDLVQGGARFMQHDGQSHRSAQAVLEHIFTLDPTYVKIQEEIRRQGLELEDTAAGSVHRQEVEALILKHKKEVDALRVEIDDVKKTNAEFAQELKEEREELQRKLKKWETERAELKKGLNEGKKTVVHLMVNAENERKKHEKWRKDNERAWQDRLDSQAKALKEEMKRSLGERVGVEKKDLEEQRLEEERKWSIRMQEKADRDREMFEEERCEDERRWKELQKQQDEAHKKALEAIQAHVEDLKASERAKVEEAETRAGTAEKAKLEGERELVARLDSQAKVLREEMARRLDERTEMEKKALEEQRRKEEREWSIRMQAKVDEERKILEEQRLKDERRWEELKKQQDDSHKKALEAMEAHIELLKTSERAKVEEAEKRAGTAEKAKLEGERELMARLDSQAKLLREELARRLNERAETEKKVLDQHRLEVEKEVDAASRNQRAAEEELRKERNMGWRNVGLKFASELPLPNVLSKPFLGSLGFCADLLAGWKR